MTPFINSKIKFLLTTPLSKELFLSICKDSKFDVSVKPFIETICKLKAKDLEINAENVFKESESKKILLIYVEIMNAIDREKYTF